MTTRYNISISLTSGGNIFNGYFIVNNSTNLITGFYELVNGSLTTSMIGSDNNILFPVNISNPINFNSDIYDFKSPNRGGIGADGFSYYDFFAKYKINDGTGDELIVSYTPAGPDNAFINTWNQFDFYGVVLTNMSYYQNTTSITYGGFRLKCNTIGDQTSTNNGKLYIRFKNPSNGNYNLDVTYTITPQSNAPAPTPTPTPVQVSNICFPSNTPIQTDQGEIEISHIDNNKYTIDSYPIVAITKTVLDDPYIVYFEAHSIEKDYPSSKTIMTINHAIWYKGTLRKAITFVNHETITLIDYKGDIMYNVLLPIHHHMKVNGLMCETLDPRNKIASFYSLLYDFPIEQRESIYPKLLKLYEYEIVICS